MVLVGAVLDDQIEISRLDLAFLVAMPDIWIKETTLEFKFTDRVQRIYPAINGSSGLAR